MQELLLQTGGIASLGMSEHVPACLSTHQDVQAHTSMPEHIPAYFLDLQSMFCQVFIHTQNALQQALYTQTCPCPGAAA